MKQTQTSVPENDKVIEQVCQIGRTLTPENRKRVILAAQSLLKQQDVEDDRGGEMK